ncbi:MAG TPA: carboxypeptidase regulatory-like domain-containing protein [Longimicrobiaceae bacterium]|nr:carboxypeptidase regulatory-like domain-containing protein [Longimicrobiaceae bacterium]
MPVAIPRALVLAASLLLLGLAPAHAQRARLRVMVVSQETGEPIAGAQVRLPRAILAAVTDAQGRAEVVGIPAGEQYVTVGRIGYRARTVLVDFTPGAEVDAEFPLQAVPVEVEGVRVTSDRPNPALDRVGFYDRQKAGFGTFLPEEWIRQRRQGTSRVTNLLRGVRGLSFTYDQHGNTLIHSSRGEGSVFLGNGGVCLVQVYIDGVRVMGGPRTETSQYEDLDDLISAQDVAAVEVYQGGAPAPLRYAHPCGSILIWTYRGR